MSFALHLETAGSQLRLPLSGKDLLTLERLATAESGPSVNTLMGAAPIVQPRQVSCGQYRAAANSIRARLAPADGAKPFTYFTKIRFPNMPEFETEGMNKIYVGGQ